MRLPLVAVFLAVLAAAPAAAQSDAAERRYCDLLQQQYDRFAKLGGEGAMPGGRVDRALGEAECRKGNYAAGQKLLSDAIRAVNGSVPPRPAG
jgi:hypothetical protein